MESDCKRINRTSVQQIKYIYWKEKLAFLVITFNAATAANSLICLYCLWIILAAKLKIFVAILVHSMIIHWDEANWYF